MSEQEKQATEEKEIPQEETQTEEAPEQTEQPSTDETAETSESATEGEETEQAEETEVTETPAEDEQFFVRTKVEDEEIVYDLRVPEQREKLREDAQKGIGFTKKSQALSDWQKANEPMLQFAQTVLSDETMQKAIVAKQLGIDPTTAFVKTQPPDEYWKDRNPQAYYQALYQHEKAVNDQARLDAGLKQYKDGLASNYNNALVEKAKVKHDLKETETKEVIAYIQENMRPNQIGMFSERQFDDAVTALYGREKMKQEKLKQSDNFNNTLKKISKNTNVAKPTKVVPPKKVSDEVAEAKRFKDYVKGLAQ